MQGERIPKRMGSATFVEVLIAIFIPPLGVFLRYGIGVEFWIDLVLTFLGYLPGIIYAVYVLVGM
ncbi:Low temperature-induced protein [Cucurbita argyrosperma subsp. argyrosperma]|uniref:Low temperature-induced protein lt101.2-like n=2 Tax=Cucurbita TaxID=3660 RepID=A0A6J1KU26_CUCMA|nr:low temperature-induced protein lt101.2-like [Cucurbita moschata]XP_023005767.1 low temperature-induced protein lt101.2-like [Cucurbita maxima]XP_023540674.1 low temperature-induced protein lt101.2-like [Cucurbita pepo subsp. pepo]KAG7027999.1 Low temperature-induced protein [Cucurbita argyrosperma subsp. argyrosperma]